MPRKANWFAKKVGAFRRQGHSFKEAVRLAKSGHHSSSASSSSGSTPSHRRTSRMRSAGRRVSHTVRHHPGVVTKAIKGAGALIAFNQEIGQVLSDFQQGRLVSDPVGSLQRLTYKASGVDPNSGSVNAGQLTASVTSKIVGYGFIKAAMFFKKHIRM